MTMKKLLLILAAVLALLFVAACAPEEEATEEATATEEVVETEAATDEEADDEEADDEEADDEEADDEEADDEEADMDADGDMDGEGMGMGGVSAVYMLITNNGEEDVTLVGASTDMSGEVQIHETTVEDDVATMQELEDGLVIPAGETVTLEPGGYHVMLLDLQGNLVEGETLSITLEFEGADAVDLDVPIIAEAPQEAETVVAGDLTIEEGWARPATVEMDEEMDDTEATEETDMDEEAEAAEDTEDTEDTEEE